MKPKTKPKTVNGLHLWAVKTQHADYWVTTRANSIATAIMKGLRFATRERPDSKISRVKHRGTLDC